MPGQSRLFSIGRYLWEPATLCAGLLILTIAADLSQNGVLIFVATNILIQMVMVIGLYVFIGNSGILAFGHITYAMIGAYADAWLTMSPFKKSFALNLPDFLANHSFAVFPSLLVAGLASGILALLTGLPLMRMGGIAISIGTFAVLVIFNTIYQNWGDWTFGSSTLVGIPLYVTEWVALAWVCAALVVATVYQKSRFGLALRSSREDEVAAHSVGIHVRRERIIGFALSGLFMGVGGILQAHFLGSIAVSAFWIPVTFILIAMLMVGGQRSLTGAVVGTLVLSIVMQALRQLEAGLQVASFNLQLPHGLSELGAALLMLVILLLRKNGLTNGREIPWPFPDEARMIEEGRAKALVRLAQPPQPLDRTSRLEAQDVSVQFGGLAAITKVTVSVARGEIFGLIGPNGAGKTTMVNVLTGFQAPTTGQVLLNGTDITRVTPRLRTQQGLARSFQAVRLFKDMTVLDNLEVAGIGTGLTRRAARDRAWDILAWMNFEDKALVRADTLPYGDERRVGLARVLATAPQFAFFDEPAAGMSDRECDDLMQLISDIPGRFGCGVLLIEHNMRVVMGVCQRIQVMDSGRTIAEGTAAEIQTNPAVIRAYLGSKSEKTYA
ncbi:branched-chain amino acid ABC transporter ATP-binding protein/permease [Acidisoma cellulosilytica]|uniref:Branched-chain amino acid ABC transporter ATP-binding protein/permease n=1 Tax=Acidisoma cellulosilyticum TaxID=2802395 RepID=A0A963Z2Q5_9PROT|nr:branched-chain amino acid ABC transporter ATP-binding protein/permease [Acidisoma cellulosilyticum]MCB8881426.1 branched-chain amino acid ABC transporter ATP-binding protein/permease [Acidisoma cellulosilyticum]